MDDFWNDYLVDAAEYEEIGHFLWQVDEESCIYWEQPLELPIEFIVSKDSNINLFLFLKAQLHKYPSSFQ